MNLIVRIDKANRDQKEMRKCSRIWDEAHEFVIRAFKNAHLKGRLRIVPVCVVTMDDECFASVSLTGGIGVNLEFRSITQSQSGWRYYIAPDGGKAPTTSQVANALTVAIMNEKRVATALQPHDEEIMKSMEQSHTSPIVQAPIKPLVTPSLAIDLGNAGDLMKTVVTAVDRIQSKRSELEEKSKRLVILRDEATRIKKELSEVELDVECLREDIDNDHQGKQAETFLSQIAAFAKRP